MPHDKKIMQDQQALGQAPNKHWQRFLDQFKEIETLPINQWKAVHFIAYFAAKYEVHYGIKFTLKFNSTAPSKSYEVFLINKLTQMLSSDPIILKDYIDVFWRDFIQAKKKRITSMSFLTDSKLVNAFKFKQFSFNRNASFDRSTPLQQQYLDITTKYDNNIINYGALAFAKQCADAQLNPAYVRMLEELKDIGFDLSVLGRVK